MKYGNSPEYPSPVLALTILNTENLTSNSINPSVKVLISVRSVETNLTHPNVISVPTQRIPKSLFDSIVALSTITTTKSSVIFYEGTQYDSAEEDGHNPVIYASNSLIASKLNLYDYLRRGEIRYTASLRVVMSEKLIYSNLPPEDQVEYIVMANILIMITKGADLFKDHSASYSLMKWVIVASFIESVNKKDPTALDPIFDQTIHGIYGLCIATSFNVFTNHFYV